MTYGEAKEFVALHLKGDNSQADPGPVHFRMAHLDVALRCEPDALTKEYTGDETDLFRLLPSGEPRLYIRRPDVPDPMDESAKLDIDEALSLAVVFFVCSYLSNKYKDRYEAKAEKVISIYVSNQLAG
ncbi:hypothetical protein [Hydrogenimonas sp.]